MTESREELLKFRCRFEKTGPLRFISHLDLTRTFHRAFRRAGLPLKFSEGFSPHPKFALALPLSVGTESLAEPADFTLDADSRETDPVRIQALLQAQMPVGLRIVSVEPQEGKFSEIALASYTVRLPKAPPSLRQAVEEINWEGLKIQKKNKKGKITEKNLAPGIRRISVLPSEEELVLEMLLCVSGDCYLKPESVLEAMSAAVPLLDLSGKKNRKNRRIP